MKRIFLLLPLIALMILSACGTPNGAGNDNNLIGDVAAAVTLPYKMIYGDTEYIPSWLYYSYDYASPISTAFSSVADTDGSDDAIRKLASDAVYRLRMKLEG